MPVRTGTSRRRWLGFAPFLAFCLVFELVPLVLLLRGSLVERVGGGFTLAHYAALQQPLYVNSFVNSIAISGITALAGVVVGSFVGYAIYRWPPGRVRNGLIALADTTTNFAGAPLAFAFIVILGLNGVVTQLLLQHFDVELYPGFSIYSFTGLVLAYTYFQLPLMVLLILPAFAGIKREWRESAEGLAASPLEFWRYIGVPMLAPSLVGGFTLLFANAFGAYATAYTLVEARLSLVTLQIGYIIAGEVRRDPGVGMAMAIISLGIMSLSIAIHQISNNRARRRIGT